MNAREYYLSLQSAIHTAPHVLRTDIQFEEIDANECYVRGVLSLVGGFELRIAEYTVTEPVLTRQKYRYHLQTSDGKQVCRWDNAPHHPAVSTFPDHRHDEHDEVHPTLPVSILDVLNAVLPIILPSQPE